MAEEGKPRKLTRVKPLSVQISYPLQLGNTMDDPNLLDEPVPSVKVSQFVEVTSDNFDRVLDNVHPHFSSDNENK